MNNYKFYLIILVVLIIVSAYFFMNQKTENPEVKMSGQFRLNPTFGMQGYQGLYFVDQGPNGAVYRVEGELLAEITEKLKELTTRAAWAAGTIRSEMEKVKTLGPTDEPTGKYKNIERKILNLSSYELIQ